LAGRDETGLGRSWLPGARHIEPDDVPPGGHVPAPWWRSYRRLERMVQGFRGLHLYAE